MGSNPTGRTRLIGDKMKEPKDYYIFTSFDFLPLSREELVIFTKELALKLVRNYKGHDISVMTDSKRGKIGMRLSLIHI